MNAKYDSGQQITLLLSKEDAVLLNNALNEILNGPSAIAEWEFQTRTGVEKPHALELLRRIGATLDKNK